MSTNLWCDRDNYKRALKNWIEKDEKFLAIGISDSQELRDIAIWIKNNAKDIYSTGMAHFDSDVEIQKHMLLQDLTIDLGEDKTFQNFYKSLRDIETNYLKLSIKQDTGSQASAEGAIKIEDISQTVNIYGSINEPAPPEVSKERQINQLFIEFISDLRKLNGNRSFLLIIRFGKSGFNKLSPDFRHWFLQNFCRKIVLSENVKICILNQGNTDDFKDLYPKCDENITEYLELNDIVNETEIHIKKLTPNYKDFCYGVIEPETNRVKYNDFKRKLLAYIKRIGSSAG